MVPSGGKGGLHEEKRKGIELWAPRILLQRKKFSGGGGGEAQCGEAKVVFFFVFFFFFSKGCESVCMCVCVSCSVMSNSL